MILVFDTSGKDLDIAVFGDDGRLRGEFHHHAAANERGVHDAMLASETMRLLKNNNISASALTKIVFINGPGSFTGLRIGLAFAKGLAFGSNVKLVPLIAHRVLYESYTRSHSGELPIGIVTEGYEPKSVYYAPFDGPENVSLRRISDFLPSDTQLFLGVPALQKKFEKLGIRYMAMNISLETMVQLARAEAPSDAAALEPFYGTDFKPHSSLMK